MPDTSAIRYRKNMYAPSFSLNLYPNLTYPQSNSHTPFRKPCCIYIQHIPCHVFHFLSPGVGRNMQDRPAWLPEYPAAPFTPQLSPDAAPAAVFSGRGIIITRISRQPASAAPCRECRSYFFFFYYDPSFHLHQKSCHILLSRQIFSPRSSPPPIIFQCPGCFVSLHTDIPFRQV